MPVNRYGTPATQDVMSTYVPIPFEEIKAAGAAQQKYFDQSKAGIDEASKLLDPYNALKQVEQTEGNFLDVKDFGRLEEHKKAFSLEARAIADDLARDKDYNKAESRTRDLSDKWKALTDKTGEIGRMDNAYKLYQQQIEDVKSKDIVGDWQRQGIYRNWEEYANSDGRIDPKLTTIYKNTNDAEQKALYEATINMDGAYATATHEGEKLQFGVSSDGKSVSVSPYLVTASGKKRAFDGENGIESSVKAWMDSNPEVLQKYRYMAENELMELQRNGKGTNSEGAVLNQNGTISYDDGKGKKNLSPEEYLAASTAKKLNGFIQSTSVMSRSEAAKDIKENSLYKDVYAAGQADKDAPAHNYLNYSLPTYGAMNNDALIQIHGKGTKDGYASVQSANGMPIASMMTGVDSWKAEALTGFKTFHVNNQKHGSYQNILPKWNQLRAQAVMNGTSLPEYGTKEFNDMIDNPTKDIDDVDVKLDFYKRLNSGNIPLNISSSGNSNNMYEVEGEDGKKYKIINTTAEISGAQLMAMGYTKDDLGKLKKAGVMIKSLGANTKEGDEGEGDNIYSFPFATKWQPSTQGALAFEHNRGNENMAKSAKYQYKYDQDAQRGDQLKSDFNQMLAYALGSKDKNIATKAEQIAKKVYNTSNVYGGEGFSGFSAYEQAIAEMNQLLNTK